MNLAAADLIDRVICVSPHPPHPHQYLLAPLTSAVQVWNYSPPEEIFHQVSIQSPVEGGGRPLEDDAVNAINQPEATVEEEEEEQ